MNYWDQPYPMSREHMAELRERLREAQAAEQPTQQNLDDYIAQQIRESKFGGTFAVPKSENMYEYRLNSYPQLFAKPLIYTPIV